MSEQRSTSAAGPASAVSAEAAKSAKSAKPVTSAAGGGTGGGARRAAGGRAARGGKKLRKAYGRVEGVRAYPLEEALGLACELAGARFSESMDIAVRLGIDAKRSEQNVRGVVTLPKGDGRTLRVAVFCKGGKVEEARRAGADVVGSEELADEVEKGRLDFDRCIATPDMMATVGKLGRVLGPRGLMPNPRFGTVTDDVAAAVKAAKGGQVEFRNDKGGIVHASVGRAAFPVADLVANIRALMDALVRARPQGSKGVYVKSAHVSSTMGVGIRLDVAGLAAPPGA